MMPASACFLTGQGGLLSGFNDIPGISLKKASEVFDGNTHQPVSGFQGGPRHVGGDKAVAGGQERIVWVWRFFSQHIQTGTGNDPPVEGVGQVGFVNQGPPASIDKKS